MEIKKYADSGDIKSLKYIFVDSLDVDPTFARYEEEYNYCKSIPGLLEPHIELTPFSENRDVSLTTDIQYSGASKRPDIITATKSADGMITVYKFDNNLDGGLLDEVPENGKEAVNEEISDTKGSISSIKSEYDKNGNLSETMVNITYTDENGGNHRTKVYIDAE